MKDLTTWKAIPVVYATSAVVKRKPVKFSLEQESNWIHSFDYNDNFLLFGR